MAKAAQTKKPAGPIFVPVEQGTDEWRMARLGILTASEFGPLMAESDEREGRKKVLYRLAGERLSQEPSEEWTNRHMDRGKRLEPEARQRYETVNKIEVDRVGFVKNFSGLRHCGCSPDGLVGFHSGLEIKTELPELLIPRFLRGAAMPAEHRAQVQGNIHITEREQWDFMLYARGLPDFIVTVYRDDDYIRRLENEIQRFNHDLESLIDNLKRRGIVPWQKK